MGLKRFQLPPSSYIDLCHEPTSLFHANTLCTAFSEPVLVIRNYGILYLDSCKKTLINMNKFQLNGLEIILLSRLSDSSRRLP